MLPRLKPLLAVALAGGLGLASAVPAVAGPDQVYNWIRGQQRSSGLVANQQDDAFSGVYVDALAAMAYLHQGDAVAAERIFDKFDVWRAANWGSTTATRGFPMAWNADTGVVDTTSDRWIGDNAWLLLALEYHALMTGSADYTDMRAYIRDWLIALKDTDGGVKSGFNPAGAMTHKSTEGNFDCYSALVMRPADRAQILNWLTSQMYIPAEQRFKTGSTVSSTALDCCSWAVTSLGAGYSGVLAYAENNYARTTSRDIGSGTATGFGDTPGQNRVWYEGTGQMAIAYLVAGQTAKANTTLVNMEAVETVLDSTRSGWPCSSTLPAWTGASTKLFVPSGAWYLYAKWNFNPMNQASWRLPVESWGQFASSSPLLLATVADPSDSARQVWRLQSKAVLNSYQGVFQKVPVSAGVTYQFRATVRNDASAPLQSGSVGVFSVEWKNASGVEISRHETAGWNSTLSSSAWTLKTANFTAPAGAVTGHFVMLQRDQASPFGGRYLFKTFSVHQP